MAGVVKNILGISGSSESPMPLIITVYQGQKEALFSQGEPGGLRSDNAVDRNRLSYFPMIRTSL
jgi:hypothetical protein